MTPQTMDLIVALQEALEELGLMKEPAQASGPGQAEVMQGEEVCVQTEGETVGWKYRYSFLSRRWCQVVPARGFEPRLTGSKPAILPLDEAGNGTRPTN